MRFFSPILLGAIALLVGPVSAAESMYVKSDNTTLRASTTASAQVLATLPKGTKVTLLSEKERWVEVALGQQRGWVYRFKLSAQKPSTSSNALAGLGGGGASVREGDTAASIRGLSPTSEKYAGRAKIQKEHVDMVKHMESLKISQKEVDAFLQAGNLGEFGGSN